MNTDLTKAARKVLREWNENAHRGGNLHVWSDGTTRWETTGSCYETPGDDYLGCMYCDPRDNWTAREIEQWMADCMGIDTDAETDLD